jgi:hypothetical protein
MGQGIMPDGSFNPDIAKTLRRRTQWFWRVIYVKVWLSAFLLIAGMLGASALLLVTAFEDDVPLDERIAAFGGGLLVLFVCLSIIRMALPEPWQRLPRRKGKPGE